MDNFEEIEYKVQNLLNLLEAFKQLNSNIELEEVFQNVLHQTIRVIDAEAGTLWVCNNETGQITARAASGPTASTILNIKMNKGEGIVGKVISSGKPHFIENVATDPSWAKRVDQSSGFITHSMITVPLIAKDLTLGALQLLNKKTHDFFSDEDVNLALAMANQSALALHNGQMYEDLYRMFMSVIKTLAAVLDARDPYTAGHSERVAKYSVWIARRIGMTEQQCEELNKAALLHDIGKIGVADHILRKPDRLSQSEFEEMKKHPVIGANILLKMEPSGVMADAVQTARSHHERINGSGYPDQLSGDEIPLFAKIVGVADTFDAMTTVRPYSKGRSFFEGAEELRRCKNVLFDGKLVDAFTSILEECGYQPEKYESLPNEGGSRNEPI